MIKEAHTEAQLRNAIKKHDNAHIEHSSKSLNYHKASIKDYENGDDKSENENLRLTDRHHIAGQKHDRAAEIARDLLYRMQRKRQNETPIEAPVPYKHPNITLEDVNESLLGGKKYKGKSNPLIKNHTKEKIEKLLNKSRNNFVDARDSQQDMDDAIDQNGKKSGIKAKDYRKAEAKSNSAASRWETIKKYYKEDEDDLTANPGGTKDAESIRGAKRETLAKKKFLKATGAKDSIEDNTPDKS